jgi:hypothetical protein
MSVYEVSDEGEISAIVNNADEIVSTSSDILSFPLILGSLRTKGVPYVTVTLRTKPVFSYISYGLALKPKRLRDFCACTTQCLFLSKKFFFFF